MRIVLPSADEPLLSVVMVTFGGWQLLRRSLEALTERTPVPFEVVIVDNPTPEDVAARLREEVEGADVILNDRNEGFGPAANRGVGRARGRFLLFLNTDAIVQPGWLEPLLETLEEDGVGVAVPLYLNEDGTVQEAGGLLFRDGSTLMYGFRQEAADPEFRFRRRVDYGSAACLLLRRADFVAAGGFDPAYVPAYCEDVDLQLRLCERGLRVVFEPRSRVVHLRFGSTGLDEATAARLVTKNTAILRERWAHVLEDRPRMIRVAEDVHRVYAARDAHCLERFLIVAERPPRKLIEALRERNPTALISVLAPASADPDEVEPLLHEGVELAGPVEDPGAWLRRRLFHYSAVIAADGIPEGDLAEALDAMQPQAPVLVVHPDDAVAVAEALDREGILPDHAS